MQLFKLLLRVVLIPVLAASHGAIAAQESAESSASIDQPGEGRFVFLGSGTPVIFQASTLYAAALIPDARSQVGLLTPPDGLDLDPRGNRIDLIDRGVTLFRVPLATTSRGLTTTTLDAWQATLRSGLPAQPVFEHGAALRIPSEEVIVTFPRETTLKEAQRLLSESWADFDSQQLRWLRPGNFVYTMKDPSPGGAFEVSRLLAGTEGVLWSEPSFITVYLESPGLPVGGHLLPGPPSMLIQSQQLESQFLSRPPSISRRDPEGNVWHVILDGDFETDTDKWSVSRDVNSSRVLPVVVSERAHEGDHSVYMSGNDLAGNTPPDLYAEGVSSFLLSPVLDLSGSTEVFIELWFWARFEDPVDAPRQVHDFGRVLLYDVRSKKYIQEHVIVPVSATGDLTGGRGTDRGWRKMMFRVPFQEFGTHLQVRVQFYSDARGGGEGLFVDDIRVLSGSSGGTALYGIDPAAAHQYEILPGGQIAGWPAASDPAADATAAWAAGVPRKRDVLVAVLDDGVERDHPDLDFWEPDEDEGRAPNSKEPTDGNLQNRGGDLSGEPVSPEDRHGTACAGVLAAIANNGMGIAGVAPGKRLLPLHRGVDDLSMVQAIDGAVRLGTDVLVIPWGWSDAAPQVITNALMDAMGAGTAIVAAAGDGVHRPYSEARDYPCSISDSTSLICVGAASITGKVKDAASEDGLYWWQSAGGAGGIDLLAPGTWLHATDRRGPIGYNDGSQNVLADWTDGFAGTGAAACYVGGVAALMVSHDPHLRPEEMKNMLTSTVRLEHPWLVAPGKAVQAAMESAAARAQASEPQKPAP